MQYHYSYKQYAPLTSIVIQQVSLCYHKNGIKEHLFFFHFWGLFLYCYQIDSLHFLIFTFWFELLHQLPSSSPLLHLGLVDLIFSVFHHSSWNRKCWWNSLKNQSDFMASLFSNLKLCLTHLFSFLLLIEFYRFIHPYMFPFMLSKWYWLHIGASLLFLILLTIYCFAMVCWSVV